MPASDIRSAIEAVWKNEAARVIGALTRIVRDLDLAEDLAQEALLVALEKWPVSGVPPNPGPLLIAATKSRTIDYFLSAEQTAQRRKNRRNPGEFSIGLRLLKEPLPGASQVAVLWQPMVYTGSTNG